MAVDIRGRSYALAISALVGACSSDGTSSSPAQVETKPSVTANDFGLADKELVLTLDDGPGPRTIELAEWLAANDVPAVFFMVGKNAKANPDAVARVVALSKAKNGLFVIANHSMAHTLPLDKQGMRGLVEETTEADAILQSAIAESQSVGYVGAPVAFFRPPYGAFASVGSANMAGFNEAHGDRTYVGPVFWDIGGEQTSTYSADWACWSNGTIDRCADGYVAEANAKKRGLMLAHDVHDKTVDMLIGTNGANGRSLIGELRAAGFKFVGLRAHDDAVRDFGIRRAALASNKSVVVDASVATGPGGRVIVDVRAEGDAKLVASFDAEPPIASFRGNRQLESVLAPGQHFVTIRGYGPDGALLRDDRFTFIVAAEIKSDGQEATNGQNAACVKFDLLKVGSRFQLFHGKVACDTAGAQRVPNGDECYASKADVAAARDPQLLGAGEWSTEFAMTYASDPTNTSKVAFQIDAHTGAIEHGRRFAWKLGSEQRADATFDVTSVDCALGVWRGKMQSATGEAEDFYYRRAQ